MAINYSVNSTPFEEIFVPRSYTFLYNQNPPNGFNGQLYGWGGDTYGNLGQSVSLQPKSSPVQIGALTGWISLSGTNQNLGVRQDGTLWGWGRNNFGQLGDGTAINKSSPVQIGSDTNWYMVDTDYNSSTIALKTDGTLWSWGYNNYGQLGSGTTTARSSPVQVGALTNWETIAMGSHFSMGVKTDGTLWTWGHNLYGTLADSTTVNKSSPIQIGTVANYKLVSGGGLGCAGAIRTDGTLWTWGHNIIGQLGSGTTANRSAVAQVGLLTNWKNIKIGAWAASVKVDGTLWAWGYNTDGNLGDGTVVHKSSPIQVGSLSNWKNVSIGGGNESTINYAGVTAAIKTDGTLWAWGENSNGGVGDQTVVHKSSPVQVGSLNKWSLLSYKLHQYGVMAVLGR